MLTKHFTLLLLLVSIVFYACSDEETTPSECENVNLSTDYQAEQEAVAIAEFNFLLDNSNENCVTLKDAYNDYLDMLKAIKDCPRSASEESLYQAIFDDLQLGLDGLSC